MFSLNTPPFHQRARRGPRRGWRAAFGQPSYGASALGRGPSWSHRSLNETLAHSDHLEMDLEDVGCEYYFSRAVSELSSSSEDLHFDFEGPILTVRTLTEVPGQRFKWQILVPEDVEMERISGKINEGLLEVRFPKQNNCGMQFASTTTSSSPEQTPRNGNLDLWRLENWTNGYRLTHPAAGCQIKDVVVEVEEGFIFVESRGGFTGEFNLPPAVDIDKITVDIINEVFVLTLPKLDRGDLKIQGQEIEAETSATQCAKATHYTSLSFI
eukprot:g52.t1